MKIKGFVINNVYNISSLFLIILYYGISKIYNINIFSSRNLIALLSAFISGVSILIGVYGVLLTNFITFKKSSNAIDFFLKLADKNTLKKNMLRCVRNGIIDILLSLVLILNDVMSKNFFNILIYFWMYITLNFFMEIYNFIKILLKLILDDKNYGENKILSDEDARHLNEDIDKK